MIDLIRRVVTRKSRIRDLILERDELAAHLVRLEDEVKTISGHLDRVMQERDELAAHLVRLEDEMKTISAHLDTVIRERYQLDPKKHPNFKYFLPGHYYSPI